MLLPGFINGHTHAGMTHMRGMAEDMKTPEWLASHVLFLWLFLFFKKKQLNLMFKKKKIWPTEARFVGHDFTYDGTELAIAEMIKGGTTCFFDMYFFPEAAREIIDKTGIRAMLAVPLLDFPTNYASGFDEYLEKATALLKLKKESVKNPNQKSSSKYISERISFAVGPHAPYTVSDDNLVKAYKVAQEFQVFLPFFLFLFSFSLFLS